MRRWEAVIAFGIAGCASIASLDDFEDQALPAGVGGGTGAAGGASTAATSSSAATGGAGGVGGMGGGSSSTGMVSCPMGSTPGATMGTCVQSFELDAGNSGMIETSDTSCPPFGTPLVSSPSTIHVIQLGGGGTTQRRDGFLSFDVDLPVPQSQILSGTLRLTPDTIGVPNGFEQAPPSLEVQAFGPMASQPLFGDLTDNDFFVDDEFLDGMNAVQAFMAGEATLQIPMDKIAVGGTPTQLRIALLTPCPYPTEPYEFDYIITAIPPVLEVVFLP